MKIAIFGLFILETCLYGCSNSVSHYSFEQNKICSLYVANGVDAQRYIGFRRYSTDGLKVEYENGTTHYRYEYDDRDSLIQVTAVDDSGIETKAETLKYNAQGMLLEDLRFSVDGEITNLFSN